VLGSDDAVFFGPPSANAPPVNDDDSIDRVALWDYAGAHLSAAEMVAACMGERFSCLTSLATMVNERRLVVDRRTRDRTNSGLEIAAGARSRLRQGDRAGAYAMAQDALRADPSSPEIHRIFATIERAHVAEIARRALSRKHAPQLRADAPADSSKLSDLQRDLVDRIDGCWDLLSLLRGSGVREADALLAFDQLRALGFVE
jgi:hypothetical protein